ncbi:MAG: restriction endonuclease subunit S [Flavobacterium sp.]
METIQPKLRFPEYSTDWVKKNLDDLCSMQSGKFINASEIKDYFEIGLYPCYGGNGLRGYTEKYNKEGNYSLIGRQGAHCGNITLVKDKFYATEHAVVVTIKNDNNTLFIYYLLGILNLNQYATGQAQPGLSVQNIKQVETYISSSIDEQTKIANFLSAVDEKLNLLKQKKSLLDDYKKGIMQKIFNQEIRFKDDKGNDFEDWKKVILSDVFDYKKGSGLSKDKLDDNGIFECVLYGELYTKYSEVIFEVKSKTNSNEGLLSEIGDLLIPSSTTTSGIDLANVTALNFDNVLLGGDITVLRSNQELSSVFYAYYLSNHKKEEIASYAQGITIVHLYYSHIKDMIIDFPTFEEQTKIANFLSAIDEKIELVSNQIQDTQEYKKGLLQQMFV